MSLHFFSVCITLTRRLPVAVLQFISSVFFFASKAKRKIKTKRCFEWREGTKIMCLKFLNMTMRETLNKIPYEIITLITIIFVYLRSLNIIQDDVEASTQ